MLGTAPGVSALELVQEMGRWSLTSIGEAGGVFATGLLSGALGVRSHRWKRGAGAGPLAEDPVPCRARTRPLAQSRWQSISLLTCRFAAAERGDANC